MKSYIFLIFKIFSAICMCPDGYTGQPTIKCTPFECQSNFDCDSNKKCDLSVGSCKDPCLERGVCGKNSQCRAENNEALCSCPPNTIGDPRVECQETRTLVCQENFCGKNAVCKIDNKGTPSCHCPPLYPNGNPKVECMLTLNNLTFEIF